MIKLNPYLNFNGNTEEAFNFYKSVFGGEFSMVMRFGQTPDAEKLSEEEKNKIMHISLPINETITLMGTDAIESMGQHLVVGNNFYISLELSSRDEADTLFSKLAKEGKVEMEMSEPFWGGYFGMFKDKFDIQWMLTCNDK